MSEFKPYRKSQIAEMREYIEGEDLRGVSISSEDRAKGSPAPGDFIARNPRNHADEWLVSGQFVADNYEPVS